MLKRLFLFTLFGMLLLAGSTKAHAAATCSATDLNSGAGKVINSNWKEIDCIATSNITCGTSTCSTTFGLVNGYAINKNDTIAVMFDLDGSYTAVSALSCTDNIGDTFTKIPSLQGGSANFFSLANGASTVTGAYLWATASAAKASGYQITCSGTVTGANIGDVDRGAAVFRQTGGGATSGIDVVSPYQIGTTSGTCNQGPHSNGCPMVAQTINLTSINDLVLGGGNENGAPAGAASTYTIGADGDGTTTTFPYFYTVASTTATKGNITFTNYDTTSGDNWASVTFALKPTTSDPPVLFYSDIIAGPASGNTDTTFSATGGVYVTLYGNFLDAFTSIQLNNSSCLTVVSNPTSWMWYERMVVKLGTTCTTGNFSITTAAGTSNGVPFTVRSGNIYYAAGSGNDSTGTGTFQSPWKTLVHAHVTMAAGDTVYGETGSDSTADDGTGWSTCFQLNNNAGTSGNSKAIIGYPGESVTIGNVTNGVCTGIRSTGQGSDYWVFAELQLKGDTVAINPYGDIDWRIIGNDLTCPFGNDQAGCMDLGGQPSYAATTHMYRVYGNNVHNAGTSNTPGSVTTLYHGVYLSEFHNDVDFGWNTVAFVMGGRCFQLNVNDSSGDYDIHIHDNTIHDCPEDGIVSTTVDPVNGTVEFYNNIIYNAGQGPNPEDGGGAWTCINAEGYENTGITGESGFYHIYHNTLYGCGTISAPNDGPGETGIFMWNPGNTVTKGVIFNNNILGSLGQNYYPTDSTPAGLTSGSNNMYFGDGNAPAGTSLTNPVNANPGFVNASGGDFHLSASNSAANGAGTSSVTTTYDHDGRIRPNPPSIGALEFASGAVVSSAPTFSPSPGTYGSTQTVTLTNPNSGTTVMCYTTDGSTNPVTSGDGVNCSTGTKYTTTISVSSTTTIKAVAGTSLLADSTVVTSTYTITITQVATPTFSPVAGTYTGTQTVTISTATGGATKCYTTDGTTPTANGAGTCTHGTTYTTTVSVAASETVKAIGSLSGDTDSAVGSAAYVIQAQAATPTFSPVAGTYSSIQSVTISTSSGTVICYTTNGTTPATNGTTGCTTGTKFVSAVSVGVNETIKAIAGGTGLVDSTVGSAVYVINTVATPASCTPTFQTTAGPTITVNCTNPNSGTTIMCYTENGTSPTTNGVGTSCGVGTPLTGSSNNITISNSVTTLKIIAGTSTLTDSTVNTYGPYNPNVINQTAPCASCMVVGELFEGGWDLINRSPAFGSSLLTSNK